MTAQEFDNAYIDMITAELISNLGIKQRFRDVDTMGYLMNGEIEKAIKTIAQYMGLSIVVKLEIVEGYGKNYAARVHLPSDLPIYNLDRLKDYPVRVEVVKGVLKNPHTFVYVMAHELAHVILHSTHNSGKESEIYTDIAVMVLGFDSIMMAGRKIEKTYYYGVGFSSKTTRYGYLSDKNFNYAYSKIDSILSKYLSLKNSFYVTADHFMKEILSAQRKLFIFKKYLKILDKIPEKVVDNTDARKIASFHMSTYLYEFESALARSIHDHSTFKAKIEDFRHFTRKNEETIKKEASLVGESTEHLKSAFEPLDSDILLLNKYIGTFKKIGIKLKAYHRYRK